MTLLKGMKIKNKLFIAFGCLVGMLSVMSIFNIIEHYNINLKYDEFITSTISSRDKISKAIRCMHKIYNINLSKGYQITVDGPDEVLAGLHANYTKYYVLLLKNLDEYRNNPSVSYMNEAEKQMQNNTINEVEYMLTNDYRIMTEELDAALNENKHKVYAILGEGLDIGDRILEKMNTLYDMVSLQAKDLSYEMTVLSKRILLVASCIGVVFVFISMLVSVIMTRSIIRPITNMGNAALEIAKGDLTHPIRTGRNDELGVLANQIGHMVDTIAEMNKVVTIMSNLHSMVNVIDFDYNMIYINKSLADMYGIDLGNYKGKKCYNVLRGRNKPCDICKLHELLPDKELFPSIDYEFIYDDFKDIWVGGRMAIIRWIDGSLVYLQMLQDNTEKKTNQERLRDAVEAAEAASTAKSHFLANMSHEIRTPMNAVLGMAELLMVENLNKRQHRYVGDIKTSTMALINIINDILDASKLQAGKLTLSSVHYDFDTWIDNISSIALFLAEGKHISFNLSLQAQELTHICLYGDDLRLRQVILNLLGNAIKFTENGSVLLDIIITDTTVNFTISDTGIGIPAENLPTLFDPFEQADVLKHRATKGTGLGLTIAKSIVELMGGKISVESVYGQGASFHVEIPKVLGDCALISQMIDKEYVICAPDAKILVVDDNATNLNVAYGLLQICHIEAETASSGQEALDLVQRNQYDIVFMDHRMPDMSGIETTKIIRGLGIDTPIIALTASAFTGARDMMLEAGMNDYLAKPIIKSELMHILGKWIPAEKLIAPEPGVVVPAEAEDKANVAFWEAIKNIEGLSFGIGLDRVDGQRNNYKKTLKLMIQEIEKSNVNLPDFVSAGDMENFRIEVHGIKGALANLGAMELSEKAYVLERASDNNDIRFCTANLPPLLEGLAGLGSKLSEAFSSEKKDYGPIVMLPELPPIFDKLISAFAEVDFMAIDQEIANIDRLHTDGIVHDELEQIKDAVLMMDYNKATMHIQRLLNGA
jgi:signal transduction histidine kinase/ActR/RegA family two-component response regulator/HAMP domain-containing protein